MKPKGEPGAFDPGKVEIEKKEGGTPMANHGTPYTEGQLAKFLGAGITALTLIAGKLNGERMTYWYEKGEEMQKAFLKALSDSVSAESNAVLKRIVSGIHILATPRVKVKDCFRTGDGVFAYRDPDFDNWLPQELPGVEEGEASAFELAIPITFQEMATAKGGIGKTWGLGQIEKVIRDCERGKNPLKLRTDNYANFFFIKTGDDFFAVGAGRRSGGWYVSVRRFGDSGRWGVGSRVFPRN